MKKLSLVALTLLTLSACGKEEKFKYSFTDNGCATGEQSSDSKEGMCSLLKDEGANKGCAQSMRKQKFEQEGCGTW